MTVRRAPLSINIPLDRVCEECNGAGVVQSRLWFEWFRRLNKLTDFYFDQGVTRQQAVERADEMAGPAPDEDEELMCPECEGAGSEPTGFGIALLQFFDRYRGGRS